MVSRTDEIIREIIADKLGMTSLSGYDYLCAIVSEVISNHNNGFKMPLYKIEINVARLKGTKPFNVNRNIDWYIERLDLEGKLWKVLGAESKKIYSVKKLVYDVAFIVSKELKNYE